VGWRGGDTGDRRITAKAASAAPQTQVAPPCPFSCPCIPQSPAAGHPGFASMLPGVL
jgi:hypothetical protein